MRSWPLFAVITLSLVAAALTCAAVPADGVGPDQATIRARMGYWVEAYNQGDVPAMLDVLSADYMQDTQGLPGSSDKRAMDRTFTHIFAKYQTHIVCVLDQVYASGGMGFDRGHYTITYTPKGGGKTIIEQGRYMEMWTLEEGVWRVRYMTDIPEQSGRLVAVM
jgi:ketosteroid isomerase-like protein